MDCVNGALKTSFRADFFVKQTNQAFHDDLLPATGGPTAVSGDEFFVDELLDFSKAETEEEEEEYKDNNFSYFSVSIPQKTEHANFSVPESELCVPVDDLADLEWLSHFVDDSFSGCSLSFPVGKSSEKPLAKKSEAEFPVLEKSNFTTPVQTKARSKRARTGGRVWSFQSPSLTESAASSSSSSCMTSSPALNTWLVYNDRTMTAESLLPSSEQKRRTAAEAGGGASQPRRCSHCLVQKTPQWRTGPLGAKTLCNACGVRYKSGRLLPEYRPACSPTFSSEVHSNNHRKVLEMRRKKEGGTGFAQPVQSF